MDAGFLSVVESGQYFMTKEHWIFDNITTERMDPREHQNWTRAGSDNQLLAW